jgi:hypothetical protein
MTATVIHAHDIGAAPTSPVFTTEHLNRLGAEHVANLARLAFRRQHRQHRQYDGYLDEKYEVALLVITHDPAPAAETFSRYEVGDVVIAWRDKGGEWTAFCPRVGWNVQMSPGCYAVIDPTSPWQPGQRVDIRGEVDTIQWVNRAPRAGFWWIGFRGYSRSAHVDATGLDNKGRPTVKALP